MPPNIKEVILFDQAALPFNAPVYNKIGGKEAEDKPARGDEESDSEREEETVEGNSNVRITTRARLSYELDRYAKNCMLIFDNRNKFIGLHSQYPLEETFQKYRFEVESYENCSRDEIIARCESFFQKDFSEYGAVAMVILADVNIDHQYIARGSYFIADDVLKYFTTNQPPSLQGKPKISIFEANDFYYNKRGRMKYPDILMYHVPLSFSVTSSADTKYLNQKLPKPIQLLCNNISEKGIQEDLYSLMVSTAVDGMRNNGLFKSFPLKIESTLTKDLMLYTNET